MLAVGCSPRLAPVGTGGLLTRSFANYSQSTVVRSEALMAAEKPVEGSRTPVPRQETTRRYAAGEGQKTLRSESQTIAPENEPAVAAASEKETQEEAPAVSRSSGIPKATEESVSGLQNVTFATPQQNRNETAPVSNVSYTSGKTSSSAQAAGASMNRRERRALERQRRAEAKRLLAEREQAGESAAPAETVPPETPASESNKSEELSVEDFLPGESSAMARAVAMPQTGVTSKPAPEFTRTQTGGQAVAGQDPDAVEPPAHRFKPNETEHVKFSYYDPFGQGNNRFVVVLDEQRFCYPYPGKFLSGYGPRGRSMHTGVDIKGVRNDTIRAAFAGTVRMSKPYSGYGNCVVIRHKNGLETLYGHNSRNLVRVGDAVQAGDPIALIGRTGRATTEHCHFEVRVQGQHINPALILDCQNHKLRTGVLAVTRQSNGRILAANRASGLAPSQATDVEDTGSPSTVAAGGGETRLASSSKASSGGSTPAASVYTVKSGDTLWGIARRFGTTVSKLCSLNNLDREATLPLGKKLKLR